MFILSGCGWLPEKTMNIIHIAYNVVRILIPAIIVVMGSIDFLKSIAGASDDEIRKNTNNFIHKLVGAAIAFIIPAAVGWIAQVMADSNASQGVTCMNQILNGTYQQGQGLPDQTKAKQQADQKSIAECKANCHGNTACINACDGNVQYNNNDNPPEYNDCYEKCLANPPQQQYDYHSEGFYIQSYNECMSAINVGDSNSKVLEYQEAYYDCIDKNKNNPSEAHNKCINEWNQLYNLTNQYGTVAEASYDNNQKACAKYAEEQYQNFTNNNITYAQTCETYCHQDRDYK